MMMSLTQMIEEIRPRYGMYVNGRFLQDLSVFIDGYTMAIMQHDPDLVDLDVRAFTDWLCARWGVSGSLGWATVITEQAVAGRQDPFALFFSLLAEYRTR